MISNGIKFFIFMLFAAFSISMSIASTGIERKEGMASEYMDIEYSFKCNSYNQSVFLIIRYVNISKNLISFDVNDLLLGTSIPDVLNLVPYKKMESLTKEAFVKNIMKILESI